MHTTVFLEEAVNALNVQEGKKYIDATFGEGGHSRLIQSKGGIVLGLDADIDQVSKEKELRVVQGNYADIEKIAIKENFLPVEGVLFDFGLSMVQIKTSGRGFTFKNDEEPLDMRLEENTQSAAEFLNTAYQEELEDKITRYSEDLSSKEIAKHIVLYRREKRIETVGDLKEIIKRSTQSSGQPYEKSLARIFQAIRMVVNDELKNIQKGLEGAYKIVSPGGTIVVISFHSVEDRIVKAFVRSVGAEVNHSRLAVQKERQLKKFERSATLRIIKKI